MQINGGGVMYKDNETEFQFEPVKPAECLDIVAAGCLLLMIGMIIVACLTSKG